MRRKPVASHLAGAWSLYSFHPGRWKTPAPLAPSRIVLEAFGLEFDGGSLSSGRGFRDDPKPYST